MTDGNIKSEIESNPATVLQRPEDRTLYFLGWAKMDVNGDEKYTPVAVFSLHTGGDRNFKIERFALTPEVLDREIKHYQK